MIPKGFWKTYDADPREPMVALRLNALELIMISIAFLWLGAGLIVASLSTQVPVYIGGFVTLLGVGLLVRLVVWSRRYMRQRKADRGQDGRVKKGGNGNGMFIAALGVLGLAAYEFLGGKLPTTSLVTVQLTGVAATLIALGFMQRQTDSVPWKNWESYWETQRRDRPTAEQILEIQQLEDRITESSTRMLYGFYVEYLGKEKADVVVERIREGLDPVTGEPMGAGK